MLARVLERLSSRLTVRSVAAMLLVACHSTDNTAPDNTALSPGGSLPEPNGAQLQLAGGVTGGEYLFVVTDTATSGTTSTTSYQISATSITAPGAVSAPATSLIPGGASAYLGAIGSMGPLRDIGYGSRLNERARRRLVPLMSTARQAMAARLSAPAGRRASVAAIAPQVGDILIYNVSADACDTIVNHPARIVAIGSKAIIAVDTLNPAGGFSAADYLRFAANFDTLIHPLDVTNFGDPTDIDQNGHVVLFFTRAVNELTARSSEAYTGGFFFARDLFPKVSATPGFACPGSNEAEMVYLLSPDPNGTINGNVRTRGFVDSLTTALVGHEFQHLINAGRRIYINSASDLEVVWLNEGLSHIAEELLFYRQGGLTPRANISITTFRGNARAVEAFNNDQGANAGRYEEYLKAPSTSSPIRDNDSLSTRGATWDLLRYAADRQVRVAGALEPAVWQALVNSKTTGIANMRAVFGADVGGMLRDWSLSHYTDDVVAGVSVDYTQPSWNWHSIYPALGSGGASYPLSTKPLTTAGVSGSVIPGGSAFYRFSVAANTTASVTLSGTGTTSGDIEGVVVRLR
jgi:hypothetical protein